ncbi:peptide deformylase [Aliigemmobacter aestuarii]|uniref:Peptide deformylase n=1 Tax=Aliigemmobacter aestuarii TaxID=1445661 RepID=A0A4S3MUS8_9RHOB|nr:peptide deformylase [Gemmobacter aestuarii]THD85301.1 peptide deformylase [Gemmobacter aestuarii]
MAVLPIVRWPDARLTTRCAEVGADEDVRDLVRDMLDTMYDAPGRGLAAPQVGVLKRLFVMDVTWKEGHPDPVVMINPDILWMSEERSIGPEGCLSLPGIAPEVKRAERIRVRWTDLEGQQAEAEFSGFAAICVQHEFDHLDGIVTLMRLSPQARASAEAAYLL